LNVTVVSKETGQPVVSQSLLSFSEVNTVPTVSLIPGSEYTLTVSAIDSGGALLSETSADFEYEPPAANLTISSVQEPSEDQEGFLLTVAAQNISGVVKYKAWFVDDETEAIIEESVITVPLGDLIIIPPDEIGTGQYLIVVQALDSNDTVLAESPPLEFNYRRPSIFQTFPRWVSSSPLAITAMTGLCCLSVIAIIGIVVLVIPKQSSKPGEVDLVLPQKDRRPTPPAPRPAPPPKPAEPSDVSADQTPAPVVQPPRAPAKQPTPTPEAPKAVAALPAARIRLIQPDNIDFSIDMRSTPFTIGRKEENDAALPLDSSSGVSGNHLILTYYEGGYYAKDERSTYGTVVDGEPLTKGQPTPLKDGSIISLGPKVKLIFEYL
jgi:pSer/pThr/pTyr-binding forkhead associated (FHA) protein